MRITRDLLLKLAKDTVTKRFAPDRNVTAVFLVGSVRPEDVVIPPATDIDLLVIYNGIPQVEREIVKLSNEIHLDIAYEAASLYAKPRELRGDPWRGWAMWDPQLLHEKGKFFEYTQSILRAGFDDPANVLKRAQFFSAPAREAWSEMALDAENASPLKLLTAAANAANALASLTGAPLPERRLLAEFPARAAALNMPDMITQLFSILGAGSAREWLADWEVAFMSAAQANRDLRLHPARLAYYKTSIEAQLASDLPAAALWPLLYTWSLAAESGALLPEQRTVYQQACTALGLSGEAAGLRIQALDAFLDTLEEKMEQYL